MATAYLRTALYRDNAPLSAVGVTTVDGFSLDGVEPTGTARRIVFSYAGDADNTKTYFKLSITSGIGTVTNVPTQAITEESVLAEGNTVAELASVTSIPAWVGKTIYPVTAMSAPEDSASVPKLKIGIKTSNGVDVYEKYEESQVYVLSTANVDVITVDANTAVTGAAVASVQARFLTSGAWSEYMNLVDVKNVRASAAQFRCRYQVTVLDGADSAKVTDITIVYCGTDAKVSGNAAEIITQTMHYAEETGGKGVGFAQCLIKHKKLQDAEIKAYVAFRTEPQLREMVSIGTGDGQEQTVKLADTNINHNSLKVQIDGKPYWGFSYNTETNEITFSADKGCAVTASYECGWEDEVWNEMDKISCQIYPDSGDYGTRFNYTLPAKQTDKTITDVKFQLLRPEGDITDYVLGTGSGDTQVFLLPHYARKDTIKCTGRWSYDDNKRILRVQGDAGAEIKISYHWIAETHEIHDITAGWAEVA